MEHKQPYIDFCTRHYLPLQYQPWWLEAVCAEGQWGAAVAGPAEDHITGVWPWFRYFRMGLPVLSQPPFSSYGGPWPAGSDGTGRSKYTDEYRNYPQLVAQLPAAAYIRINMHPERQNWLPLYWAGFRQTVRYTYRFLPGLTQGQIWNGFFPSLRTHLRKSEKLVQILRQDEAVEALWVLNSASWRRQGLSQPHDIAVFRRLHRALQLRGHSALWMALGAGAEAPVAALYLIFDERYAGVLITGANAEGRAASALHALYWEAIRFALQRGLIFDFEGSMHPGIEQFFRMYNAVLTPYHCVYGWGWKYRKSR